MERVLGDDHSVTLANRYDLTVWRRDPTHPAGIATALEQLLEDVIRVVGPDDDLTLNIQEDIDRFRDQATDADTP
ncbi:hypothetical protein [Streptomyces sp. Tue6028]|uniref:hypothetical protein n=1 Tax=Streptomyces sp. Tue6028 TaxID=2036037 RepID=UPI003D723A03